jgi:hypothetical protein
MCGSPDSSLTLDLNNPDSLGCGSCSETFTVDQALELARDAVRKWEIIAAWIKTIPTE